ncbi:MAG: hypothetical protein ACR2PO_00970 [Methyloligellaceae bacterium]
MIEPIMFVALGFLLAGLVALLLAPPLWRRAVRLTARKLESTMPMTVADIQADKDQLRAEFAIKLRQMEMAYEKAREKSARHLVERNRGQARANELTAEIETLKAALAERTNEITVLEQTVRRKIPELEAQLGRAREIIISRDKEIQKLKTAYTTQTDALKLTKQSAQSRRDELELLRQTLERDQGIVSGRRSKAPPAHDAEPLRAENQRLAAEMSRLREQSTTLQQSVAHEKELLKSQMRVLAEKIMHGPAPAVGQTAAQDGQSEAADGTVKAGEETEKPARRGRRARKRAAADADVEKKSRKSLSERLRSLAGTNSG